VECARAVFSPSIFLFDIIFMFALPKSERFILTLALYQASVSALFF